MVWHHGRTMDVEHYFTPKPKTAPKYSSIYCVLRDNELALKTASGVFSKTQVDAGTYLLIQQCEIADRWKILDLGCGYGVVGIALGKAYDLVVVASDINERAIALTTENARKNGVKVKTVISDGFTNIKGEFNTILFNPPQTAGKKLCLKMIEDSKGYLKKGGSLQIVARHQKGGKALRDHMKEIYGNAESIARKGGYHIYISRA